MMTLRVASFHLTGKRSADQGTIATAIHDGATAIELRVDGSLTSAQDIRTLIGSCGDLPAIVTTRAAQEGGQDQRPAAERAAFMREVVADTNALVDFEFVDFRDDDEVRGLLAPLLIEGRGTAGRLILSYHDFDAVPADLRNTLRQMRQVPGIAAAKLAYYAAQISDSFLALDLLHEHHQSAPPIAAIAMGEAGVITRVLAPKFNAFATYAGVGQSLTAPGQVSIRDLCRPDLYGRVSTDTKVFGVIGAPVAHSMSPALQNAWMANQNCGGVFLPLLVDADEASFGRFVDGCVARPWLDVGGFSVTIPHKQHALRWHGDEAEELAERIGAANTLAFAQENSQANSRALNTDAPGAMAALQQALDIEPDAFRHLRVDVLGTGGAARAIIAALTEAGADVTVYGRSPDRTSALAAAFDATAKPWRDLSARSGEIIVNATNVGMVPHINDSPLSAGMLAGARLVFDMVYNPLDTRLLKDARRAGAMSLNGLPMFLKQAALQFEAWTGKEPSTQLGRRKVLRRLLGLSGPSNTVKRPRVFLVGYRGSGKTSAGRSLAAGWGTTCLDTDDMVVWRSGRTIARIFQEDGEPAFREMERQTIEEAIALDARLISIGGGAVCTPGVVDQLCASGTVVWLRAEPETLHARIEADDSSTAMRPRLTAETGIDEVRQLLAERIPIYEAAAHVVVETDAKSPDEIAREIEALLSQQGNTDVR